MKKSSIFIITISLAIITSPLPAEEMTDPFRSYLANQNIENFRIALDHYQTQTDSSQVIADNLKLAYLYYLELDRTLNLIGEEIDDQSYGIRFQFANLLLELKRFEEAIPLYEALNEAAPDWSCPWRHKGEALYSSGKLAEAEIALLKAIETRVEHYDAYAWLAEVQRDLGKNREALETLETGLSYKGKDIEDPEEEVADEDVQFLYLELLRINGSTAKAAELESSLRLRYPDDPRLIQD
ncbi:MAG: hypothetical protein JW784_02030 [Candidatus Cloacimonetes bacterium]|nr:hypothetical protein [Candidatus Cloacimonadota bacterium]